MSKIFLSTWTILSLTLIALPGWATNSKILIRSDRNLAQVLSYSNSPHPISINQVTPQEPPPPSPQRGAPKPKRDRD